MTPWPAPLIRMYLGRMPPEAVLAAADDPDAKADRSRPRRLYVRFAWNDHAARGREISQRAKNSAAVHRERRLPLGQLQADPLHDGRRAPELPADYYPVQQLQLGRFDGKRWVRFGDLVYDE